MFPPAKYYVSCGIRKIVLRHLCGFTTIGGVLFFETHSDGVRTLRSLATES